MKKYSRRAFLGLGAVATANTVLELSGGTGLVRLIANILSTPSSVPEWELPAPIKMPYYVVDELDKEVKQYIRPHVELLLNSLYNGKSLSANEIANQVAFMDTTKSMEFDEERSKRENKLIIKSNHKYGQALLLPFEEGAISRYFFVTAYHNFKNLGNEEPIFYVNGKTFFPKKILIHSENSDLAFGYCSGPEPINVKPIIFSKKYNNRDSVQIVPSSSLKETKRSLLEGRVIDYNVSYILADTPVIGCYSGSPMLINRKVVGITTHAVYLPHKTYAIGISTRHFEEMLKFYIDSC